MDKKKQEALWKRSVSASHKLWCDCADYTSHFLLKTPAEPKETTWPTMDEEEDPLMAAIRALEEGPGDEEDIILEEDIEIVAGAPEESPPHRSGETPSPENADSLLCGVGSPLVLLAALLQQIKMEK